LTAAIRRSSCIILQHLLPYYPLVMPLHGYKCRFVTLLSGL